MGSEWDRGWDRGKLRQTALERARRALESRRAAAAAVPARTSVVNIGLGPGDDDDEDDEGVSDGSYSDGECRAAAGGTREDLVRRVLRATEESAATAAAEEEGTAAPRRRAGARDAGVAARRGGAATLDGVHRAHPDARLRPLRPAPRQPAGAPHARIGVAGAARRPRPRHVPLARRRLPPRLLRAVDGAAHA